MIAAVTDRHAVRCPVAKW